jgi:putative NIF3 family GTP cyclohydrolase 1 type 2
VKKRRLEILFRHDISLFGFHLPMDAQQEIGNNWCAARELGWTNLQPFGLMNGTPIGVKGTFAAKSRDVFCKELEKYYAHSATIAYGGPEKVESAALISGGAYKSLSDAAREGIDCFVTGNFDEPAWHAAMEEGVNFFAMGHAATEKVGPRALAEKLSVLVPTQFIDVENPF